METSDADDMKSKCRSLTVDCLYSIADIPRLCQASNIQISADTNRFMLYLTLRKLGPCTAEKIVKKCT